MASATPSPAPNIRTPKLTYRTKSTDKSSFTSSATDSTPLAGSAPPASPSGADFSSLSPPPIAVPDPCSHYGPRRPSIAASSSSSSVPSTPELGNKKKASFFAGLLSVKEPSAQALLEYQKQMKKQAPGAKGRISAVGLPGISSAQLPSTVPKVNSRWDGIPQPLKKKERKQHLAVRESLSNIKESLRAGHSEESVRSSPTYQPRRPKSRDTLGASSTRSGGSLNRLADLYGWEVSEYSSDDFSKDGAAENPRPSTSRTNSSTQSTRSLRHPTTIITNSLEPPRISHQHLHHTPKRHPEPEHPSNHTPSPKPVFTRSSPQTPSTGSPLDRPEMSAREKGCSDGEDVKAADDTPTDLNEDVKLYSPGPNVLGPPASVARHQKEGTSQPPTRIETVEANSPGNKSPGSGENQKDASVGRASIPEIGSPQRRNSAQERLNLGMSLKHQAVPPWTWSEIHPETRAISNEGERITSPSPKEGLQSMRKKRLTLFRK